MEAGKSGNHHERNGMSFGEYERYHGMSLDEYERHHAMIIRMRWIAVFVYLIVVIGMCILPFIDHETDVGEDAYAWVIAATVILGTIGLLGIIVYPFFDKRSPPRVSGSDLLEGVRRKDVDLSVPWVEKVRTNVLFVAVVAVLIVFSAVASFDRSRETLSTYVVVFPVILFILAIFSHLDIVCTPTTLSFHYGPIGKTLPLERIENIRTVSVNPLREYMGWGIRIGADGSIGFISGGNVGVRIELDRGKDYVITVSDPQGLVDYVEAAKRS